MGPKKQKNIDPEPPDGKSIQCKGCPWTGKSILMHFAKNGKDCKKRYSENELLALKELTKEKKRKRQNVYDAEHRDEKRLKQAKYDAEHREEKRISQAEYDAEHREEKRIGQAKYDKTNRKSILQKRAVHYQVNRGKLTEKAKNQRKLAKDRMTSAD